METFRGRAHLPGVDKEWSIGLELDWDKKEVNVHIDEAPGSITTWPGLVVQTFGTYEIAFKTKGIPPVLTHWWHFARSGSGAREMFTVRRIVAGEGVERKFPVHSPRIAKVDVKRSSVVRRAKLYFLRDRVGKAVRLKERRR